MKRHARAGLDVVMIGCVGVVGFLVLLVASNVAGPWATPLRVLAVAWLLMFGVLKIVLDLTRRR